METHEGRMTSGEIKFFVDDVECPDTNGVGVGAKGGIFNCGLTGSTFEARCTTICEPKLSVVELKLWKDTALTLNGEHYIIDGGRMCDNYGGKNWSHNSVDKVFETGSYWYMGDNWPKMFCT